MPTVTIGFVPRERFSLAAESLRTLFDNTRMPFNLVVVDCNIPDRYRREMDAVLENRPNVKIIRRDHYLLPNQSKNLVIPECSDDFLAIVENDCLVKEGWLSRLIAACEEHPADVAVPLIVEGRFGSTDIHFDDLLGTVREVDTPEGVKLDIVPREVTRHHDRGTARRTVYFMEQHCLLLRRSVFDRIGPWDEKLNTRDEIDLSLALYQAKVPVVFEPACEIHYLPPYPPESEDSDFFFFKWDLERAAQSRKRIQEKWNLVRTPGEIDFVKDRNLIGQLPLVRQELEGLMSSEDSLILVDQEQWRGHSVVEGLRTIPFIEHEGQYWGTPADDEHAVKELERLRRAGASFIAFPWTTVWWLEHYSGFASYLRSTYPCALDNDRLVVFDLRRQRETQATNRQDEAVPEHSA